MENENKENKVNPQPLDIIIGLREVVKPFGVDIHGYRYDAGRIHVELGLPHSGDLPTTQLWRELLAAQAKPVS
ncbi:MAG: hypothetical protein FWC64_09780 [Treponema sp.]|nr:hypothetical protein [Treponema sp.]